MLLNPLFRTGLSKKARTFLKEPKMPSGLLLFSEIKKREINNINQESDCLISDFDQISDGLLSCLVYSPCPTRCVEQRAF